MAPLKVPYVFGGDGSTLCIPPSRKKAVESALVATKQMAKKNFGMQLRIGMVPMNVIQHAKHKVLVGKYQPSSHFQQAMFQGDGLGHAESLVKDPMDDNPFLLPESQIKANGSFEGFECRWNEIPSPHEETVAILVQALEQKVSSKETIYSEVSQKILEIYGHEEEHHPLQLEQLSLTSSQKKLSCEVRIRTAFQSFWNRWSYALKLQLLVYTGKFLMAMNVKTENVDWGKYKQKLIANTDYRKFDEILRMILSGTSDQRSRLIIYLKQLHDERKIVFGIHASPSALMTCLIFNYDTDHIHFLDGSNGGYAMAAKEMKRQLKEL